MLSSTSRLVNLIALYSLASITIADPLGLEGISDITLAARSNCPPISCGQCSGINYPSWGYGVCTQGTYQGCGCTLTCGNPGPCNQYGCAGVNDPDGGLGICTAGTYAGCSCSSVCGSPEACNENGCAGINLPSGAPGFCTAGDYNGCNCTSICGDQPGSCTQYGCNGVGGICQGGDYLGCPCGTDCGNLYPKPCNQNGCAGINVPALGLGICTGEFNGCSCTLACPSPQVSCSSSNCYGYNGVCSMGSYIGCYCIG